MAFTHFSTTNIPLKNLFFILEILQNIKKLHHISTLILIIANRHYLIHQVSSLLRQNLCYIVIFEIVKLEFAL